MLTVKSGTSAYFTLTDDQEVTVKPCSKAKAQKAACLALRYLREHCDVKFTGGELHLVEGDIVEGLGNGSSTSDCTASIRAVFDAANVNPGEALVARLVVEAEGASDSTMISQRRLPVFAQHSGEVVERFATTLPPMKVVAAYASGDPVDTDGISREFDASLLNEHEKLLAKLRYGVGRSDVRLIGEVATRSLELSQKFCSTPRYTQLREIADFYDCLGLGGSHSGTAVFFLLPCGENPTALVDALVDEGFDDPMPPYVYDTVDAILKAANAGL